MHANASPRVPRIRAWLLPLSVAITLLAAGPNARGATPDGAGSRAAITLGPGSTLWLEGTSNIHDFESRTTSVGLAFTRDPGAKDPTDPAGLETFVRSSGIQGLDLQVPIASMHSGKSGLDKNMQKALRADANPVIHFHLAHYTVTPKPAPNDTMDIHAEGTLSIAGRDRPVTLDARAWRGKDGIWLEGSQKLQMTQFDVRPPTMMMGALRVNDHITVRYRLLITPAGTAVGMHESSTN